MDQEWAPGQLMEIPNLEALDSEDLEKLVIQAKTVSTCCRLMLKARKERLAGNIQKAIKIEQDVERSLEKLKSLGIFY